MPIFRSKIFTVFVKFLSFGATQRHFFSDYYAESLYSIHLLPYSKNSICFRIFNYGNINEESLNNFLCKMRYLNNIFY